MATQESERYEAVAAQLLERARDKLGLDRVEGKQPVAGQESDTTYELDAKGVSEGGTGIVVIECRRYTTSRIKQEQMAALAYRIEDTGAEGGITVSPLGVQKGADMIAKAENVINVQLAPDSTPSNFTMQFLNRVMIGYSESVEVSDKFEARAYRPCDRCGQRFEVNNNERLCPDCTNEG